MSTNTRISGLLMPALLSIRVHYDGWDEAAIAEYLSMFYEADVAAELAPFYLETALDDPFYYLEYALGYSLLQKELRDAQEELGAAFDLRAFNEAAFVCRMAWHELDMQCGAAHLLVRRCAKQKGRKCRFCLDAPASLRLRRG